MILEGKGKAIQWKSWISKGLNQGDVAFSYLKFVHSLYFSGLNLNRKKENSIVLLNIQSKVIIYFSMGLIKGVGLQNYISEFPNTYYPTGPIQQNWNASLL